MGKPYSSEIEILPNTYEWALRCDIDHLVFVIRRLSAYGLVSVGSGGSFTAASFHAWLHETATGKASYAVTPYQVPHRKSVLSNSAVSILSAEGKNKDVLGAFQSVLDSEPKDVLAIALKANAPLITIASQSNSASSVCFDMPWGKDGYLATNSLFATCILLYRAYQRLFPRIFESLPLALGQLLSSCMSNYCEELTRFANSPRHQGLQPFLLVYGECGRIASVDFESKIAESALGSAQISDFRNFAHGRHLWAHENRHNATAIVIWSDEDQLLYQNFSENLPSPIPLLSMYINGPRGWQAIASIWGVLKLIEVFGKLKNIDPGEPNVPEFGRRIYALDAFEKHQDKACIAPADVSLKRKFGAGANSDQSQYSRSLVESYNQFKADLSRAEFACLILDYDATLCSSDNRFKGLPDDVTSELVKLLSKNVVIGIATGRGKSVLKDFQKVIPNVLQNKIWVGLYNCSLILPLSKDFENDCSAVDPEIQKFHDLLKKDKFLENAFDYELRPRQLTLNTLDPTLSELAWRAMNEVLASPECAELKVVKSTHSWDILRKNTSKLELVKFLENTTGASLCIGDQGLWPGNDYELLASRYSLSVDETSPLENRGWNIAPVGLKGVAATLYYLRQLEPKNGNFKFLINEK